MLIKKLKVEYYRLHLKCWVKKVEKGEKDNLFNIYDNNQMFHYLDKIDRLYFG